MVPDVLKILTPNNHLDPGSPILTQEISFGPLAHPNSALNDVGHNDDTKIHSTENDINAIFFIGPHVINENQYFFHI